MKATTTTVTLVVLMLGQICFGQGNTAELTRIDKWVGLIDKDLKSMDQIEIYFIFDTGKEGQVMVKNTFHNVNLKCKVGLNDDGNVTFYFKRDSLKMIRYHDYDPIEESASRETKYYFHRNNLVFIHDSNRETTVGETSVSLAESRGYMNNNSVVKHLQKSMKGIAGDSESEQFSKIPFSEANYLDENLLTNKEDLLAIIRKGWMTADRVKVK